jgi:hypothetical protein
MLIGLIPGHRKSQQMFEIAVRRPPTPQMRKAFKKMEDTESYLFNSSHPTGPYLENALSAVRETRAILAVTKGNGTGPCRRLGFCRKRDAVFERGLLWLQRHHGLTKEQFSAKYPDIIEQMENENREFSAMQYACDANWVSGQDRELPNLLYESLHHDRLGRAIDEVLHLSAPDSQVEVVDPAEDSQGGRWC